MGARHKEKQTDSGRTGVAPVIMGTDPPKRSVLLGKTKRPLNGYACIIQEAKFKDGTKPWDVISDRADEYGNILAWLQFKDLDGMRRFGQMIVDYADMAKQEENESKDSTHGYAGIPAGDPVRTDQSKTACQEIDSIGLSMRAYCVLRRGGMNTVEDVCTRAEAGNLLRVRNLGKKALKEILDKVFDATGQSYHEKYGMKPPAEHREGDSDADHT